MLSNNPPTMLHMYTPPDRILPFVGSPILVIHFTMDHIYSLASSFTDPMHSFGLNFFSTDSL